jgi:hypothetical protein
MYTASFSSPCAHADRHTSGGVSIFVSVCVRAREPQHRRWDGRCCRAPAHLLVQLLESAKLLADRVLLVLGAWCRVAVAHRLARSNDDGGGGGGGGYCRSAAAVAAAPACTSAPPPCHPIVHCRQGQSRQCRLTRDLSGTSTQGQDNSSREVYRNSSGADWPFPFSALKLPQQYPPGTQSSTNIPLRCVAPAPRLPSPRPAAPALAQLHASSEVLQPPARRRAPGSGGRTLPPAPRHLSRISHRQRHVRRKPAS